MGILQLLHAFNALQLQIANLIGKAHGSKQRLCSAVLTGFEQGAALCQLANGELCPEIGGLRCTVQKRAKLLEQGKRTGRIVTLPRTRIQIGQIAFAALEGRHGGEVGAGKVILSVGQGEKAAGIQRVGSGIAPFA